jgi:hypothetical protein
MLGPVDPEKAAQRVMDGAAWDQFCDTLKMAGLVVQQGPEDPQIRAEGLRYLTRLTRAALETFVEHADPAAPVLQRVVHETAKMGNDNPDNIYFNAAVSGDHTYRLHGTRGSVHWLEFATQKGTYGEGRGMPPTGRIDGRDLTVVDGRFEVVISREAPTDGRDWLPMEEDTGTLIVRQSWLDRDREVLPELHLERLDGRAARTPLSPVEIELGLRKSAMLVAGASRIFKGWVDGFQEHVNALPRFDQALSNQMGGVPEITYHHSYWRLAPDEVLLIESDPHPCDHWNFQLSNPWMESLDYRYDRIHLNSEVAGKTDDGRIHIAVSASDPGLPNWLSTQGLGEGAMCFRWVRPEGDPPIPSCRVVKRGT